MNKYRVKKAISRRVSRNGKRLGLTRQFLILINCIIDNLKGTNRYPTIYVAFKDLLINIFIILLTKNTKTFQKCPICSYSGRFLNRAGRRNAECPKCFSLERHRFQFIFLSLHNKELPLKGIILHCAPEKQIKDFLMNQCSVYISFDRAEGQYSSAAYDIDIKGDLCYIPIKNSTIDMVFASHVLEHIINDHFALNEIARILNVGGKAILPVPIFGFSTIEYGQPCLEDNNHVRRPGLDYFEKYKSSGFDLKIFSTDLLGTSVIKKYALQHDYLPVLTKRK